LPEPSLFVGGVSMTVTNKQEGTDVNQAFYDNLTETMSRVLTTGPERMARLVSMPDPWAPSETTLEASPSLPTSEAAAVESGWVVGTPHIPTSDHDTFLAGIRRAGHWKMPPALTREDFERRFASKARAIVTLEMFLADLRAGKFPTAASLAKCYGKAHTWTRSLMFCCMREGLVSDIKTWHSYFSKRPAHLTAK